ncbi:MAG TPA: SDR family oxidoreductase [Mycobacteriales bacterium]|nr:SDR family oxidoreductase [Mycobacteriales bacterium]
MLITGASTGIGRACALHLDALGIEVLAGVRKSADGESLRAASTSRLRPVTVDVAEQASIDALVAELGDAPLSGLVNNAGIGVGGPIEFLDLDEARRCFDVNVFGLMAMTKAMTSRLRAGRGRIVNMGSIGGRVATPFLSPYSASKYAVEAVTDSLRVELRPWGIHVAVIEPGSIATPIWDKANAATAEIETTLPPEGISLYGKTITALKKTVAETGARGVSPEKVAKVVAHALTAARPRTRYVVGADARAQLAIKRLLPDRAADTLIAKAMGL